MICCTEKSGANINELVHVICHGRSNEISRTSRISDFEAITRIKCVFVIRRQYHCRSHHPVGLLFVLYHQFELCVLERRNVRYFTPYLRLKKDFEGCNLEIS